MTAGEYRELRAAVLGDGRVGEGGPCVPAGGGRPAELELQSRWFAGEFGREFTTTTGQRVEVVQMGTWNHGAGPDFSEVAVRVGGRLLTGCLELDWDARDWERHGHAENPAYEGVVLHVFFEQPAGSLFFTRSARHREVAQVRIDLGGFSLAGAPVAAAEARCGRCSFPLREWGAAELGLLFGAAARQRLEGKAARLARLAELHGWDQALFQEVAGALGYRRNQRAMVMLAQRLPLRLLSAHAAGAEALLFGAAGFLETRVYEQAAGDSREYLRGLWESWWKHRGEFGAVEPPRWVLTGVRPQNHPQRRLGALAQVVRDWKKIRGAWEPVSGGGAPSGQHLAAVLAAVHHPYWDHHYTLTSRPAAAPLALIGATRRLDILANVFFPYVSLRGGEKAPGWWLEYTALPASLENEKSRRAALRLLGRRRDAAALQSKLFHQQALLQIYDDFCLRDSSECEQCCFPEQLARWRGVLGDGGAAGGEKGG